MEFSLISSRLSDRNNASAWSAPSEYDQIEVSINIMSDNDPPFLSLGSPSRNIDVRKRKHMDCINEADSMFPGIAFSLAWIPFEFHRV